VNAILQFSFLLVPPVTFFLTRWACVALRDRAGPERTERRVPVERESDGGYQVPYDDKDVDWMLEGGAAPGVFDEITEHGVVRGPRVRVPHRDPDQADVADGSPPGEGSTSGEESS
jgi:hypothetical protein